MNVQHCHFVPSKYLTISLHATHWNNFQKSHSSAPNTPMHAGYCANMCCAQKGRRKSFAIKNYETANMISGNEGYALVFFFFWNVETEESGQAERSSGNIVTFMVAIYVVWSIP